MIQAAQIKSMIATTLTIILDLLTPQKEHSDNFAKGNKRKVTPAIANVADIMYER